MIKILSSVSYELLISIFFDVRLIFFCVLMYFIIKQDFIKLKTLKRDNPTFIGRSLRTYIEELILAGLLAGFLISIANMLIGITIGQDSIIYLIYILIILAIINIRYVSFVYAGSILILISVIFGRSPINLTSILILIGIFQLVEAILIGVSGGKDRIPVFIQHNDSIAGAFLMQKIWPVPFVFITFMSEVSGNIIVTDISWAKLLEPEVVFPAMAIFGLDCIMGFCSFCDVSITQTPGMKCRKIVIQRFSLGILILIMGLLSVYIEFIAVAGAVITIAAREFIVFYNRNREKRGDALYKPVERGIKVLDVLPNSNAEKLGIMTGDTILNINNMNIQTVAGLKSALNEFPRYLWIDVISREGKLVTYENKFFPSGIDSLGIITVPREHEITYNIDSFESFIILKNLVTRFRNLNKNID